MPCSPLISRASIFHSFFLAIPHGTWDLSSLNRGGTSLLTVGLQSLKQWTAREVPSIFHSCSFTVNISVKSPWFLKNTRSLWYKSEITTIQCKFNNPTNLFILGQGPCISASWIMNCKKILSCTFSSQFLLPQENQWFAHGAMLTAPTPLPGSLKTCQVFLVKTMVGMQVRHYWHLIDSASDVKHNSTLKTVPNSQEVSPSSKYQCIVNVELLNPFKSFIH